MSELEIQNLSEKVDLLDQKLNLILAILNQSDGEEIKLRQLHLEALHYKRQYQKKLTE
jgi:hypothetical protein